MKLVYRRILIKLSGEALGGESGQGLDRETLLRVSAELAAVARLKVQMGVVIGGGNFMRGINIHLPGITRMRADQMGMLATILNGLALQGALAEQGVEAQVLSAIAASGIVPLFQTDLADTMLNNGQIVILAAGTGHPFFSTDTAAAIRALEIGAQAILKATKVDGVYDRDPHKDKKAVKYNTVSYNETLQKHLAVMDATAISLCRENNLPIIVFKLMEPGNLSRVVQGQKVGTIIKG